MIVEICHCPWAYGDPPKCDGESITKHALDKLVEAARESGVKFPDNSIYSFGCKPIDEASETFCIRMECSDEMGQWARYNGWVLSAIN